MIEAEAEAKANAALLEAQALDTRAAGSAHHPEILEYRFQQRVLEQLEAVAARLPQIVSLGAATEHEVDFTALSRRMLGVGEQALFSEHDMQAIRERVEEISARIAQREREIATLRPPGVPAGEESDRPGGES